MTVTTIPPLGPWSPLRVGIFRALWIASLVSNVGTTMHTVGAAWAMTSLTSSPAIVSLAQTAWTVPGFLFALPAGAFADVIDRRRLIIWTQAAAMVVATALGALQIAGNLDVPLLLLGTFLLSIALTLSGPAFMALIPELVGPEELPQAIGLNNISYNGAQSLGPALAGVVIAISGAGAVFLLNAVSFLGIVLVARAYHPADDPPPAEEGVVAAMRTGVRYFLGSPQLKKFALRIMLAFAVTSALTALLPLVARNKLDATPGQFGVLSAALGVGAIVAVWILPRLKSRIGVDALVFAAAFVWAIGTALLASTSLMWVAVGGLVLAGASAMITMNVVYSMFMLILPSWVRGRASSVVMLVVWLGASAGAFGWGALASSIGVPAALVAAAVTQVVVTAVATMLLRLVPPGDAVAI